MPPSLKMLIRLIQMPRRVASRFSCESEGGKKERKNGERRQKGLSSVCWSHCWLLSGGAVRLVFLEVPVC
jgi:hypothetical protein